MGKWRLLTRSRFCCFSWLAQASTRWIGKKGCETREGPILESTRRGVENGARLSLCCVRRLALQGLWAEWPVPDGPIFNAGKLWQNRRMKRTPTENSSPFTPSDALLIEQSFQSLQRQS